jgi:hypothetical protein
VIYVVDSSDSERLNISKDELMAMLNVRSTPAAGVASCAFRVARGVQYDES